MSAHTPTPWEIQRQAKNMEVHLQQIDRAVEALKKWPTVTTINNLRLDLKKLESAIKAGDAALAKVNS